jgi:hypothetical protein
VEIFHNTIRIVKEWGHRAAANACYPSSHRQYRRFEPGHEAWAPLRLSSQKRRLSSSRLLQITCRGGGDDPTGDRGDPNGGGDPSHYAGDASGDDDPSYPRASRL